MIKKLLFTLSLCMFAGGVLFAQSTIKGVVKGPDGYGIQFLQILLKQEDKVINGAYTDDLGEYQIFGVAAGTYDLSAGGTFNCPTPFTQKGIYVSASEVKFVDLNIDCSSTELKEVVVVYVPPVFDKDNTTSGAKLTGEEVRKSPGRSITRVLANLDGVASQDGSITSVRGSRSDAHLTIIDGVRVRGAGNIPMSSVEGLELIQGGIPAEYGDGTSFAIITTRGVSRDFNGGVDLEASLEGYNQMLGAFNLSGPLLKGKSPQDPPRMGFLISAEGNYNKDPFPAIGGTWVAKDEVIQRIIENPVDYRYTSTGYYSMYRANELEEDAFEKTRVRKNAQDWGFIAQGKIDIMGGGKDARGRAKNNLRFSLSGTYEYEHGNYEHQTYKHYYFQRYALFNYANNRNTTRSTLRLSARLNHRVKTDTAANAVLKNVMYDINVNYTLVNGKTEDPRFKDNFFQYGHIGKFQTERINTYKYDSLSVVREGDTMMVWSPILDGYQQVDWVTFNSNAFENKYNSELSNYTENLIDFFKTVTGIDINDATEAERNRFRFVFGSSNYELFEQYYGLLNGGYPGHGVGNVIGNGLYWAPGVINTVDGWDYNKTRSETIGAKLSLSLNLKNHEIKFGFELDKLTYRSYDLKARELWNKMRELTYYHNFMQDLQNPYWISGNAWDDGPRWEIIAGEYVLNDTLMYPILTDNVSTFQRNFSDAMGIKNANGELILDQYLDIDSYNPNLFKLEYFSNYELLNNGFNLVNYSGYDYTGRISRSKFNRESFFANEDKTNANQYAIGAYEPIYMAWYIQDKFSISNLLFNVGLRLDYFNANQYVLKDPFLLRPAWTVQDLVDTYGWEIPIDNWQSDWIPYVSAADYGAEDAPHTIVAYRSGKTWYNHLGQEVTDIKPYMGTASGPVLQEGIDPSLGEVSKVKGEAFDRYIPQVTPMPRISFSFPVSNNSLFYANYNIMTYRPQNLQINPIAYLYISQYQNAASIITNPNLRGQRVINYEIGFKQRVGETSALSFAAFYTEQRDLIQSYLYTNAYPNQYFSYENADFGTVQGLILGIQTRGTKNLSFRAGYTLQFAKGTGSTASSNLKIIASGQPNLRTLNSLEFDQRHKISANINFRFDNGASYNGPVTRKQKKGEETVKEIRWLENSGISLMFSAASGMPYSRSSTVYSYYGWSGESRLQGVINGANMPWIFQCDLRLEKAFMFDMVSKKKTEENGKKKSKSGYLNVYLDFQNLLNIKNVINVYDYTGNPTDDGYLASSLFMNNASALTLPLVSAMNYYEMAISNPYNYSQPFRVKLGIQFYF